MDSRDTPSRVLNAKSEQMSHVVCNVFELYFVYVPVEALLYLDALFMYVL